MAYSKQSFSVGNVVTATQLNQFETNIADHKHGQDNVLGAGITFRTPNDKTAGYTIATTDVGGLVTCSGTFTVTLPPLTDFAAGGAVAVHNRGTGTITLDGDGAETISGQATRSLGPSSTITVYRDSNASEWRVFGASGAWSQIETVTAAANTELTFESGISSFDRIRCSGTLEMSSTGSLFMQFKANGAYRTSSYFWRQIMMGTSGPLQEISTSQSSIELIVPSAGATRLVKWESILDNHKATGGVAQPDQPVVQTVSVSDAASGFDVTIQRGYCTETNVIGNVVDGIKLLTTVGNFTKGFAMVEGQNK